MIWVPDVVLGLLPSSHVTFSANLEYSSCNISGIDTHPSRLGKVGQQASLLAKPDGQSPSDLDFFTCKSALNDCKVAAFSTCSVDLVDTAYALAHRLEEPSQIPGATHTPSLGLEELGSNAPLAGHKLWVLFPAPAAPKHQDVVLQTSGHGFAWGQGKRLGANFKIRVIIASRQ